MHHRLALVALLAATPTLAPAQTPVTAVAPAFGTLPGNTEVMVALAGELSSQRTRQGDAFDVTVSRDVVVDGRIVIPRGTPGKGEVVYRTGKGAFGKSGKIEVVLRSLQVDGRTVPLTGRFRQEGRGNTAATIGTVVAAGLIAGALVTGHSAVIEQGRELKAFTAAQFAFEPGAVQVAVLPPLAVPAAATMVPVQVAAVQSPAPTPVATVPIVPVQVAAVKAPTTVTVPATPVRVTPAVAAVMPIAPRPIIALIQPTDVTPRVVAAAYPLPVDPIADYQRKLAAQRGVHGRDARQGWTISD